MNVEAEDCDTAGGKKAIKCPECDKGFKSNRAMYGHLRCHPERDCKENKKKQRTVGLAPDAEQRAPLANLTAFTKKRSIAAPVATVVVGQLPSSEETEAALGLLYMFSHSDQPTPPHEATATAAAADHLTGDKNEERDDEVDSREASSSGMDRCKEEAAVVVPVPGPSGEQKHKHTCRTCGRGFTTHQGLGGHVASMHGSRRANWDPEKAGQSSGEHRCSVCGVVFPTGPALGGHKRQHWNRGEKPGRPVKEEATSEQAVGVADVNPDQPASDK